VLLTQPPVHTPVGLGNPAAALRVLSLLRVTSCYTKVGTAWDGAAVGALLRASNRCNGQANRYLAPDFIVTPCYAAAIAGSPGKSTPALRRQARDVPSCEPASDPVDYVYGKLDLRCCTN
jgi:hypothetical protein